MTSEANKPRRAEAADQPKRSAAAGPAAVLEVGRQLNAKPGLIKGLAGLVRMNQPAGFDCPGCAWPEESGHRKLIDFCENGAKAFADEAMDRIVDAVFFERYSLKDLQAKPDSWLNAQGRLTQPVCKRPGDTHYRPITWVSAMQLIANQLRALETPNQAALYTSGRTSNEAAFLWQLFARCLGTNNLPDCSNLCHESSGTALKEVIGTGKGTVRLRDFDAADAIFVLGQNPGSNHPRMLATLQKAKERGTKIVAVNPLDEIGLRKFRNPQTLSGWVGKGDDLCDLHVPIRINGDVAFLQGMAKAMLEAEDQVGSVLDHVFIDNYTDGFAGYAAQLQRTDWHTLTAACGVDEALIRRAADIAIAAKSTICCWAMGLTQHQNAVSNIQEIVNFLLLRGNFGRPGAGACPVRGHSNVQGDRTMGIWEKPERQFLEALGKAFKFKPPREHGLDTVDTLREMAAGNIRVLLAMGGNFLAAAPDTAYSSKAVRNCALTVQVSTKLNRSHVIGGQTMVILPTLGRSERDVQAGKTQFITTENSMGLVSKSSGVLAPASSYLKSEIRIIAELADATFAGEPKIAWLEMADDYDLIRERIEQVIPGFENFLEAIYEHGFLELPHAVRDRRQFDTRGGKARFTVHRPEAARAPAGQFIMMTIRSHDQFNTTVYSQADRYRGIANNRRVVFMNAADIQAAGLQPEMKVSLTSQTGRATRTMSGFSVMPYDIPSGCVATYYPETNALIPIDRVAAGSNTPAYKSVPVSIRPVS